MKRAITLVVLLVSLLVFGDSAATSSAPTTLPESSASYDLSWWTADGGGGHSEGQGGFMLDGTAGQPDADVLEGDDYSLSGGFWAGGGAVEYRVYLPMVVRDF